jgi:diguanylate cyclase (GGDEF)-like protein
MISLTKSLTEFDRLNSLSQTSLECYLAALRSIEQHAVEVTLEEVAEHRKKLREMRGAVETGPEVSVLLQTKESLDAELKRYARRAGGIIREKEKDIRDILAMLAEAASAMSERGERHTAQLRGLASELESVSALDNLSLMRKRLAANVGSLKSCLESMRRDNQTSVEQLQNELRTFRRRLQEAEAEAATDPLTGLANRREAEKLLNRKIDAGRSFCIMLFDLDGFKQINDRHGHHAGDQILKTFSKRLVEQFRADDVVCRWGGDEFLAILGSTLPDPVARASTIASNMSGLYPIRTSTATSHIRVSASVGVAQHEPGESGEDLFARADSFLYQSKGVTLAG